MTRCTYLYYAAVIIVKSAAVSRSADFTIALLLNWRLLLSSSSSSVGTRSRVKLNTRHVSKGFRMCVRFANIDFRGKKKTKFVEAETEKNV